MVVIGLTCRLHPTYHAHRDSACVDCHHMFEHVRRLQSDAAHFGFKIARHKTTRNHGANFVIGCPKHKSYGGTKDSGTCADCHILFTMLNTLKRELKVENNQRCEYVTNNPEKTPTGREVRTCRFGLDLDRYRW